MGTVPLWASHHKPLVVKLGSDPHPPVFSKLPLSDGITNTLEPLFLLPRSHFCARHPACCSRLFLLPARQTGRAATFSAWVHDLGEQQEHLLGMERDSLKGTPGTVHPCDRHIEAVSPDRGV